MTNQDVFLIPAEVELAGVLLLVHPRGRGSGVRVRAGRGQRVVVAGRLLAGGAPHGALLHLRLCCESPKVERWAHVSLAVLRKLGFWGFR